MTRIFCAPLFYIIFLLATSLSTSQSKMIIFIALSFFWLILEITDVLDGYLSRKWNLVSNFGKIMDPFADVLSRLTFFSCFVLAEIYPFWPLPIMFWRELSITFIRSLLAKIGVIVPANWAGKTKAILYFGASIYGITLLLLKNTDPIHTPPFLHVLQSWAPFIFILTMLSSVISALPYFIYFVRTKCINKL